MQRIKVVRDLNKINSKNADFYTIKFFIEGTPIGNPKQDEKLVGFPGTFHIKGWINQDTYEENIRSKYEPLANNGSFSQLSKALTMMGAGSLQTKFTARKVWVDIDSMSWNFSVFFQAEDNAYADVEAPIRNLQTLVLPIDTVIGSDQETLFLYPPVKPMIEFPSVTNFFKRKASHIAEMLKITDPKKSTGLIGDSSLVKVLKGVKIGNFISMKNVIVEEVNTEWNISDPDPSGIPLSAKVDIKMTTYDLWTQKTIVGFLANRSDEEIKAINIDEILGKFGVNLSEWLQGI